VTVANLKEENITISSNASIDVTQKLSIKNPKLWDIDDPQMYKAVSQVFVDGSLVDTYYTPFGVRYFSFDPDQGFFLNGRHVKLNGVNMHHDLGPLGAAVNRRATQRQLEIMKEMGVNAIRTAHNPPSPEQLDLCDEMGILVIDETFDEWSEAKYAVENSYNIWFNEWAEKDTRALIKRDRNHPSVIMWSIGNEIPDLDTEIGKKNAKMLSEICREMDPSRPVNAGVHLSTVFDDELAKYFDVFGMNYWQDRYDTIHKQFPNLPMLSTETSATLSTRGEYHFPVKEIYKGYYHPSKQITSYDVVNTGFGALPDVEFDLQKVPWQAGQFVWSGFDYHGEPDPYEEGNFPAHSSYFGIVDMCGFKKDRFYLYQSQWSGKPMIHLLPHWNWKGREGETTPVYVYSNCASVELFVNGKSQGKKENDENIYRFKWEDIKYQPGSIKAIGYDQNGQVRCEKEIKTAGAPSKVSLTADRSEIDADGEDLAFVTVKITDKDGNVCPKSTNLVRFEIEGEGTLAAVGNGDPTSTESYQKNERSAFHGLCLLIVKSNQTDGVIKITATADNLETSTIEIQSIKPTPEYKQAVFKR
jgi:beta-galactosidase